MMAGIPAGHPLHRLLAGLTERNFTVHLGWRDPHVIRYVTEVLTDFVHVDRLYKIRNQRGKRLDTVVELLFESEVLLDAQSLDLDARVPLGLCPG